MRTSYHIQRLFEAMADERRTLMSEEIADAIGDVEQYDVYVSLRDAEDDVIDELGEDFGLPEGMIRYWCQEKFIDTLVEQCNGGESDDV